MINEILKYDKDFIEAKFKSYVDNVFVQIYLSIMTKQLKNVRHFMTDEIFNNYNEIIENLKKNKYIQMYDELNVKSSEITNVAIKDNKIIIYVRLVSRYMDYIMPRTMSAT